MQVKLDTKEKFHVITLETPVLAANMTADLYDCFLPYLQKDTRNVVLSLKELQEIDLAAGETLVKIQQKFYENKTSFVICELHPNVEQFLEENDLLEMMNVTPSESEAWDIVQMEEIERELLGDE